jgi:ketosteroid isomerase-like protein
VYQWLFLLAVVAIIGCTATLRNYQPKSVDEAAIKAVLVDYEKAINNHDVAGILSVMNEKAEITTGMDRRIVSKEEYAEILPQRFTYISGVTAGTPEIVIKEKHAIVKFPLEIHMKDKSVTNPAIYLMIRENNNWLILKTEYE